MIYCIIKNLRREIKTILISINTYAICPFPPDLKPPNEGIIPWLGGGGEVSLNAKLLTSQE
ncbi:hypothetical protein [Candidatus Marithrix sp. Canyon 246]|uniref:hypothetical protein n=1 Tax=Candidatus Marithrix sp. Canyon 246 TaxID=1827136 RepID=UPI000849FD5E|nr:hypothetical protein [Candidatus Marithrix sp. Canyon 246]